MARPTSRRTRSSDARRVPILEGMARIGAGPLRARTRAELHARDHRYLGLALVLALGLAVAFIAALPDLASGARKTTLRQSSGNVTASVSFRGSVLFATNVRLRVERAGRVLLAGRVRDRATGRPTASAPTGLAVRDLDGDGEPEVVLDLHTGGAHCCTLSRIHRLSDDGAGLLGTRARLGQLRLRAA